MGRMISILWAFTIFTVATAQSELNTTNQVFNDDFQILFASDHFKTTENGQIWEVMLDKKSGSGFQTKHSYRFGWFTMKLKLVAGDSAGVVTAYYMASKDFETRDELDFEFLGNRSGQPYALQTNIYVNGVGLREQRNELWFDPTEDFHTYSFLWNNHQIIFFVDLVPLRVYRHTNVTDDVYPKTRPMYVFSSIWNADNWATMGGLEKTDWTKAPFVSSYEKFNADACMWEDPFPACVSTTGENWWDQPGAWTLTEAQKLDYDWARRNFLIYDYCLDTKRFNGTLPVECSVSPW